VARAQQYIATGHSWVIDLDLEKVLDRVNHDKLMGQIAKPLEDKRLLKLIRAFLNAGVMENGLVSLSVEGTPQGGQLSPLLSNIVLDELDRELEPGDTLRTIRGRRQHICPQRTGGPTGDGKHQAIHHPKAEAQGKRDKERGGATAGTEVPRVQLLGRSTGKAHHRAEIFGTVQVANPGGHAKGQGRQHQDDNGRVGLVHASRTVLGAPGVAV
jgi:hypothetical protein